MQRPEGPRSPRAPKNAEARVLAGFGGLWSQAAGLLFGCGGKI